MTAVTSDIDLSGYVVTDDFFGRPWLDMDEWRDDPTRHRQIHGGFEGTDTRFTFYMPDPTRYRGRLLQPLEGANAGHENIQAGPLGVQRGSIEMAFRNGGYMVESNMGHIGDVLDPKAGEDPTIYGWRAAAESARLSKFVAAQVLGSAPKFAYVYGGSGGARRSPLCLAYAPGVWDAAMPYMGDAIDGDFGDHRRVRNGTPNFSSMFNVQRVLGPKIYDVIDAMWPGGSGNPFDGLDTHQREELANLYRIGYPRGDEFMIAQPMGQIWLWSSMAERLQREYPDYWRNFWTKPGHVGFDQPELVNGDLIDAEVTVTRLIHAKELLEDPAFSAPEFDPMRKLGGLFAAMHQMWDTPMAIQVDHLPEGYRLGAGVQISSGEVAGRQLYVINGVDNVLLCDGEGEASNQRFGGVVVGDRVHVDNHAFLAYCYFYRHHLQPYIEYEFLKVDGIAVFDQYESPEMSPFMGTCHTAEYEGKLMWVHHTHDASLWPPQGLGFKGNVERIHGVEEGRRKFRLRWTENAEHISPDMASSPVGRDNKTWLIDTQGIIEQCLVDLMAWVEDDVEPIETAFEFRDGNIILPPTAAQRGGIQPVVQVRANGATRVEVVVGEPVTLEVHGEVPAGAGTIISVKWDLDGSGSFPLRSEFPAGSAEVTTTIVHAFERAGTWFPTAMVESHRDGDALAVARRVPNLASARVVVR